MGNRTHDADQTNAHTDAPRNGSGKETSTGAGQEATNGSAPEQHDRERQSEYGGGGANGGSDGGAGGAGGAGGNARGTA